MKTNWIWRKIYHRWQFVFGMLLLAAVLMLCSFSSRLWAEGAISATSKKAISCQGLKPFGNINELLNQFYVNRDSLCLFKMSPRELEEIWGVRILDAERQKPKNLSPLSETEFYYKPYNSDKDAFYIELKCDDIYGNRFELRPTKQYFDKFGLLYPEEVLPDGLPIFNTSPTKTISKIKVPDRIFPVIYKNGRYLNMEIDDIRGISLFNTTKIVTPYSEEAREDIERRRKLKQEACGWWFCYKGPGCSWFYKTHAELLNKTNFENAARPATSISEVLPISAEEAKSAPCRALRPFDNIDELLYQFYINLDSDCLFKMSREELEKRWGVKILMEEGSTKEDHDPADFVEKPYKNEKDGFYIVLGDYFDGEENRKHRSFDIQRTSEYIRLHGIYLYPKGNLPSLMPILTFPPETSPCKMIGMDIVMRRERWPRSVIRRNR